MARVGAWLKISEADVAARHATLAGIDRPMSRSMEAIHVRLGLPCHAVRYLVRGLCHAFRMLGAGRISDNRATARHGIHGNFLDEGR